ncbi:hypothetical protein Trydic_g23325 [Trypoxylus dichotomus]
MLSGDQSRQKKKIGDWMANKFVLTFPTDSAEHDEAGDTEFPSYSVPKEEGLLKTLKIVEKTSMKQNPRTRSITLPHLNKCCLLLIVR